MISLLSNLVEIFTNIPDYILFAIESFVNLMFSSIEGLFLLTQSILGSLPTPGAPEYIQVINWFFPIGLVISIATPIMAGYITWISVKFIFKKIGDL